jgi:hypothetical protein
VPRKANTWVADKVEAGRRYAKPIACPKCGADVLRGPGCDPPDFIATINPDPVTELHAAIEYAKGRRSYALMVAAAGIRLELRDRDYRPTKYAIVLDHRCEKP